MALVENTNLSAICCDDDLLAGAVYRAAVRIGRRIPDDLSVVGFDDIEMARILSPELTTVSIPASLIGATATHRLIEQLKGATRPPASPFVVDLSLVVRGSTGLAKSSLKRAARDRVPRKPRA
jgi:LacI family transcriptional regulator/LacI family repressor for deo operon, udp, cdd, tsx, nupC, and nupG